jgi:integrase/recombinase XerC
VRAWRAGVTPTELVLPASDLLRIAVAVSDPNLSEVIALVTSDLCRWHDLDEQATRRTLVEIGRFTTFLTASGIDRIGDVEPQSCVDFIDQAIETRDGRWAQPSVSTRHVRRCAIRVLFRSARSLNLADGDPTLDIRLPPRSKRTTRPLSDDEVALGRVWAVPTIAPTRHAAAWALAEATATTSEIAEARIGDVDLVSGTVFLHGNARVRNPRQGHLTAWGLRAIEARINDLPGPKDQPLVSGATRTRNARQASVCSAVSEVLELAGLSRELGVKPASLPAWGGRRVFEETGQIQEAARALGVRSLDRAAEIIGWDW